MIITFARQYGSGGRDIGLKLAELLNYRFYDREILELAAENSSIHPDIAKRFDEKPASSLLYSAFMASGGMDERQIPLNQKLALAQFQVIRDLANEGNCIFLSNLRPLALIFIRMQSVIFVLGRNEKRKYHRHGTLLFARTGQGQPCGQSHRPVLAGCGHVRDDHRSSAL